MCEFFHMSIFLIFFFLDSHSQCCQMSNSKIRKIPEFFFWKIGSCRYTLTHKFWSQSHSSYSTVNNAAHCTITYIFFTFLQEPLPSEATNLTLSQHQGYSSFIILVLLCVSFVWKVTFQQCKSYRKILMKILTLLWIQLSVLFCI
jgi:hypothetical protein